MPQYATREIEDLGEYYFRHVQAMTAEELYEKSHIAAELAYRDKIIDDLKEKLQDMQLHIKERQEKME